MTDGRCITRPRTFASSAFLTGAGAVRLYQQVVHVDPRKPLRAAADGAAEPVAEEGDHLPEGTAVFAEDDAETGDDDADPFRLGPAGLRLPVAAEARQEIVSGAGGFIQFLVLVEAVIPDGGGGEERHSGGARRKGIDDVPRRQDAALADELLVLLRPAREDGGAGEVDDEAARGDLLLPGASFAAVAGDDGDSLVEAGRASLGVAHDRDVVSLRRQLVGGVDADEAGAARYECFGFHERSSCL
jgi:hypothetical protein